MFEKMVERIRNKQAKGVKQINKTFYFEEITETDTDEGIQELNGIVETSGTSYKKMKINIILCEHYITIMFEYSPEASKDANEGPEEITKMVLETALEELGYSLIATRIEKAIIKKRNSNPS